MYTESEIIEYKNLKEESTHEFTDPLLIFSHSKTKLIRLTREGKYFLIKTGEDAFSQSLLKREYDISRNLDHPYLIHIWTYTEDSPVGPGLVMEYVNGESLTAYLAKESNRYERERIFTQIIEVVSYIHQSGIIHNDLKPDNILITQSDHHVKLIDFGLSDNDSHGMDKSLGYSHDYASPEQEKRCKEIDGRSDIYALGKIMQDLFPNKYRWIMRKCTREAHEKRYANVEQLAQAWKKRNIPFLLIGLAFSLAILTIPTVLYTTEHRARIELEESIEEKAHLTDSLTDIIHERLTTRYEAALDSIEVERDKKERFLILNRYLEYSWRLMDDLHDNIEDLEILARIDAYCNQLRNAQQDKIMSVLNK